ncbi:MAG: lipoyl synthase [Nitrospirae bacterium]|nr:lipoyl synthase [Nitrospirota bacterium]
MKNRRPEWLRVRLPGGEGYLEIKRLLRSAGLHTVCEEAHCPNIGECFNQRTATFLILGDVCTRGCRFCNVTKGVTQPIDPGEPERVALASQQMGLRHVVVTSVTRDDIPDGGAQHYANTISSIRSYNPESTIEVLIPDFGGDIDALSVVIRAMPDIINHNMETVPRLYRVVRPGAMYERSLMLLKQVKKSCPDIITKSGLMVGLGEEFEEMIDVMKDLREGGCEVLTLGQYLSPGREHLPVQRFYHPDEFEALRVRGRELGFTHVEAGPLVRSSYHAAAQLSSVQERLVPVRMLDNSPLNRLI